MLDKAFAPRASNRCILVCPPPPFRHICFTSLPAPGPWSLPPICRVCLCFPAPILVTQLICALNVPSSPVAVGNGLATSL